MARRGADRETTHQEPQQLSYLQPEILPVQLMVDVLKERGIKASVLQEAERSKVIHLFYKYVSPKYQRDYRDNRRGKLMKKTRERKRIRLKDEDWETLVVESKHSVSPSSSTKALGNNGGERLKPPPSCINADRKKIKLSSAAKTSADLDFLIIKKNGAENNETKESNKNQTLSEKRKPMPEPATQAKKLKEGDCKNEMANLKPMEDGKRSKHDRKPITWP